MANNNVSQTAWAEHLRGCAVVANEIAKILDIREDAARQAMFATVAIDAKNHGVFLEPVPQDAKTPVKSNGGPVDESLEGVPFTVVTNKEIAAAKDKAAADKADAQIKDVPRVVPPEVANGQRRTAFLAGIESARNLLNKEGHVPPVTPQGLCTYIKDNFTGKTNLGSLDLDELERLTMLLSSKLDVLREKKAKETEEAPF